MAVVVVVAEAEIEVMVVVAAGIGVVVERFLNEVVAVLPPLPQWRSTRRSWICMLLPSHLMTGPSLQQTEAHMVMVQHLQPLLRVRTLSRK